MAEFMVSQFSMYWMYALGHIIRGCVTSAGVCSLLLRKLVSHLVL